MDQKEFLPQEKLDTLANRVGRLFTNLNANFNTGSTIWTVPVRMALSIEANEESVDSVVLEARKSNGYLNNNSANPKHFNIILTRVYILLRYKHHDEEVYLKNVFPTLIADMGAYGAKDNLTKIDSKIDEIIAIDKMISKKHQSIDKTYIPTFTVPKFSKRQLDFFFSRFTQERLFREMQPILKSLCDDYGIVPDLALVWYMGRDIVLKLSHTDYPELHIDRILDNLSHENGVVASHNVDLYMVAAFSIMRTVTKDNHFQNAIKNIIKTANDRDSDHVLIRDNIVDVAKSVKEILPITDFDYTTEELPDITGEKTKYTEEPKEKSDALQKQLDDLQAQLAEKDQKIDCLEKQIENQGCPSLSANEDDVHAQLFEQIEQKPILKFVWKLMKLDGADETGRGAKTTINNILKIVTGFPYDSCKKVWEVANRPITRKKEDIAVLNQMLKDIGMNIQL